MSSKSSKAKRTEDRIRQLEKELADIKKQLSNQEKVVQLDEEQFNNFLSQLADRIEQSTSRIVDESSKQVIVYTPPKQSGDGFSFVIKYLIGLFFIIFAIVIAWDLFIVWPQFWNTGWANRTALLIIASASLGFLLLGIDILREKDRNYIIALFSALVALVALIVTLAGQVEG